MTIQRITHTTQRIWQELNALMEATKTANDQLEASATALKAAEDACKELRKERDGLKALALNAVRLEDERDVLHRDRDALHQALAVLSCQVATAEGLDLSEKRYAALRRAVDAANKVFSDDDPGYCSLDATSKCSQLSHKVSK